MEVQYPFEFPPFPAFPPLQPFGQLDKYGFLNEPFVPHNTMNVGWTYEVLFVSSLVNDERQPSPETKAIWSVSLAQRGPTPM